MTSVIAIAGLPGSGKTKLIGALQAQPRFSDWDTISTGGLLRERHAFLVKTNKYAEDFVNYLNTLSDSEIKILNNKAQALAYRGNVLLDSRYTIENCKKTQALKVFLTAPLAIRVQRRNASYPEKQMSEIRQDLEKREYWEHETGTRLYGYDYRDHNHYDLVLDTSKLTVEEEVAAIIKALENKQ